MHVDVRVWPLHPAVHLCLSDLILMVFMNYLICFHGAWEGWELPFSHIRSCGKAEAAQQRTWVCHHSGISAWTRILLFPGNINFFFFFFLVKKSLKINILGWKPIKSSDWQTIFLGTSFSPNKNISVKRNRCSQWKTLFNYNSVKKPADRFLFFPPSPLKCVQMAKAWKPQLLL